MAPDEGFGLKGTPKPKIHRGPSPKNEKSVRSSQTSLPGTSLLKDTGTWGVPDCRLIPLTSCLPAGLPGTLLGRIARKPHYGGFQMGYK